jgi:hypothetical protein
MRWAIGVAGLAVATYGGWLLLSRQDADQILNAGVWLVSGVLLHDFALTAVVLLAALAVGVLPRTSRAPALVALVVVGEQDDNQTHLDRPYLASWLVLVALAVVIVVVAGVVRSRKRKETA